MAKLEDFLPERLQDEAVRLIFQFADRCNAVISKSTVCIYVWQERIKRLAVLGSGILLRVGDRHFLLSAAHVLDYGFYLHMPLVAQPNEDPEPPITLDFVGRKSSDPPPGVAVTDLSLRDDDPLDISLAELTPDVSGQLAKRYRYLTLSDFDPTPLGKKDGVFVLYGFPQEMSVSDDHERKLDNWPLGYVTFPLNSEPERRDRNKEILLKYYLQGSGGRKNGVTIPKPRGLSGCGIWRIAEAPIDLGNLRTEYIRLVGIQHRWRPDGNYIVGTSVIHFLDYLWGLYPDLHPALNMWRR